MFSYTRNHQEFDPHSREREKERERGERGERGEIEILFLTYILDIEILFFTYITRNRYRIPLANIMRPTCQIPLARPTCQARGGLPPQAHLPRFCPHTSTGKWDLLKARSSELQ